MPYAETKMIILSLKRVLFSYAIISEGVADLIGGLWRTPFHVGIPCGPL